MFETEKEILEWYEKQPRTLSASFLQEISWSKISEHPLDPKFVPVIRYMRDVESFTEIYYRELLPTPTGKSPYIRKFMDRWSVKEREHANLLNRFLNEAGIPTSKGWWNDARSAIPVSYSVQAYATSVITRIFGRHFSGVHMVWGAINEMTTLQGYRRLWQLARNPILEQLLRAVAQEESIHSYFYWSMARLRLRESGFTQQLSRFVIDRFWTPVGQGAKPESETNYVISTLFMGREGLKHLERTVSNRTRQLPGFAGFNTLDERVRRMVEG